MKSVATLTLALSLLATGSVFAAPQTTAPHIQAMVAQDGAEHAHARQMRMAQDGAEHAHDRQMRMAQDGAEHAHDRQMRMAQDGAEHAHDRQMRMSENTPVMSHQFADASGAMYVAEVRSEFGSQYQRY